MCKTGVPSEEAGCHSYWRVERDLHYAEKVKLPLFSHTRCSGQLIPINGIYDI